MKTKNNSKKKKADLSLSLNKRSQKKKDKKKKDRKEEFDSDNSAFCTPLCHLYYCETGEVPYCCELTEKERNNHPKIKHIKNRPYTFREELGLPNNLPKSKAQIMRDNNK